MDISFIYKSLKLTLLVSAVSAIAFLRYFSPRFSLGLISGSLWNVVNIFLFIRLSKALTRDSPRKLNIFFLALLKFAGLYAAGYFIVSRSGFSLYGICLGFSLFFLVVFCQSMSMVFTRKRIGLCPALKARSRN